MPLPIDHVFTWRRARDWAQSKNPAAIAGLTYSPWHCPLACCFNELEPGCHFEVCSNEIRESGDAYRTPTWAAMVISMVDEEDDGSMSIDRFRQILDLNKPTPLEAIWEKG